MKQTAVEWLIDKLTEKPINDISDEHWFGIIGQAKEMEKEQIENAFRIGATTELTFGDNKAEQYYIKEYGGEQ